MPSTMVTSSAPSNPPPTMPLPSGDTLSASAVRSGATNAAAPTRVAVARALSRNAQEEAAKSAIVEFPRALAEREHYQGFRCGVTLHEMAWERYRFGRDS